MHLGRCWVFWLWAGVGTALALSVVSVVGVFTGIPALVALLLLARLGPRWPEPLGLLTGIGALCLFVASVNRGSDGLDATPWLVAGVVLAAGGILFYAEARRT